MEHAPVDHSSQPDETNAEQPGIAFSSCVDFIISFADKPAFSSE
jgi:hypothetical protein